MMMTTVQPRKAKEPSASVYRREDRFIVNSQSKTTVGVWIACEPFLTLPMDASDRELGEAVLAALERSAESVPHPDRSERLKLAAPLLKAAEVKSWKAFASNTISVGVRQQAQKILLIPYENCGPKGGFVQKLNHTLAAPLGFADGLGAKVREGLALAS